MEDSRRRAFAARLTMYFMALSTIVCIILHLCKTLTYGSWEISEWLINYEAGFVRRGICGQFLYELYKIVPYDPILGIKAMEVFPAIAFPYIILHTFKKEGWSPFILISGCCLFYTFFFFLRWARKDFLLLSITYCLYLSYRNIIKRGQTRYAFLFMLLSSLQMLIHEAAFFFTFPILLIWRLAAIADKGTATIMAYLKTAVPFIPAFLTFCTVVIYKGDEGQATQVWHSWQNIMNTYPDKENNPEAIGIGVAALGWDATYTFKTHLKTAFLGIEDIRWYNYLSPLLVMLNFLCTYYFITRLNTVRTYFYKLSDKDDGVRISNFLLLQFIFMIPMFTILSCDWGRTLPYWTLSSLMACHIFKDINIAPLYRLSSVCQKKLQGYPFNRPYLYIALMLLTPYTDCFAPSPSDSISGKLLLPIIHNIIPT